MKPTAGFPRANGRKRWRAAFGVGAAFVALSFGTARAADRFGFTDGTEPIRLEQRSTRSGWASADQCGDCHAETVAQWEASRHRISWTNDIFQAGFLAEPQPFCIQCHAPAEEQLVEVVANLDIYTKLWFDIDFGGALGHLAPEPKAAEGVNCVVCHLRDGQILTASEPSPDSPHEYRVDPLFGTSAACTTCHDFQMVEFVNGALVETDQVMQATAHEWEAWRERSGRTEHCPDCHMPDGDHTMPGANTPSRLRKTIHVAEQASPPALVLSVKDVGHAVPTGDLFRHLTLEARCDDDWTVLSKFGRTFAHRGEDGEGAKQQVADTRLVPGTDTVVEIPAACGGQEWRLRYHLGGSHDEARGLVPLQHLIYTVKSGTLPPTGDERHPKR